jgi:hypothetical protein
VRRGKRKFYNTIIMGAKQSYEKLPTRAAKLSEVISPIGLDNKVIAYADDYEQALEELKEECLLRRYPALEPIPFHDGKWHCGVIRHPGIFKEKLLYNTVFFGTDKQTGRKCAWFYGNIGLAPGFITV